MIVELSYVLSPTTVVYPGVAATSYEPTSKMSEGGLNNVNYVRHFLHTGTHVDAPLHVDEEGESIDEIPIENFVYRSVVVLNTPKQRGELITGEDLSDHMESLSRADLVLFHTGYCRHMENREIYQDDFPAIDLEVARIFRDKLLNVVAIGIDTLGIESLAGPEAGFPVHKQLLQRNTSQNRPLLIYENVNTGLVVNRQVTTVWALPVRFGGTEAAPVAIVAELE